MKTAKEMEKYADKNYQCHIRKAKRKVSAALKSAAKQGRYSHILNFNPSNEAMVDDMKDWLTSLGYHWRDCRKQYSVEVFWGNFDNQEGEA